MDEWSHPTEIDCIDPIGLMRRLGARDARPYGIIPLFHCLSPRFINTYDTR
jgi:hypothetical protein